MLFGVDLLVREGEVATLLGRNGMGKTTTVRALLGLNPPRGGRVEFGGESTAGATPEAIARRGIGLVPEGRQVFPTLTVRENLVATAANRLGLPEPWDWRASTRCSRAWPSGRGSMPAPSRAASSRCWRSAAR
ncbi:ATP-binding cassette domain-containing protein [Teichococcus aestuarii]